MLQINGISIYVEDLGSGRPVLLLHGWPDSAYLWRNQIPFLVKNGFRAIAPDLRGLGRSGRPEGVAAYSMQNAVSDVVGILDAFGIDAADIVGHDWGAAVAWFTATAHPDRVHKLVVLSVPHPLAPRTPGPPPELPLVEAATLGIWSANDHYLDGEGMKMSGRFVKGPWRYEQIDGASHWIPLDACDRLNQLLIEWLS